MSKYFCCCCFSVVKKRHLPLFWWPIPAPSPSSWIILGGTGYLRRLVASLHVGQQLQEVPHVVHRVVVGLQQPWGRWTDSPGPEEYMLICIYLPLQKFFCLTSGMRSWTSVQVCDNLPHNHPAVYGLVDWLSLSYIWFLVDWLIIPQSIGWRLIDMFRKSTCKMSPWLLASLSTCKSS